MSEQDWLSERFTEQQGRLRAMAYRMLGSPAEAEDAVQEAWLRVSRADVAAVDNFGGWLTTITARVCLNLLESRRSRPEPVGMAPPEPDRPRPDGAGPEDEALLADSVGAALLLVLDTLTPAERLAFVLHDIFDVPFDEVATVVGRSPAAARQLASRARRRVQSASTAPEPDPAEPDLAGTGSAGAHPARTGTAAEAGESAADAAAGTLARERQQVVAAFLTASRTGDFRALLTVLAPGAVLRADAAAVRLGAAAETRGAQEVATFFSGRAAAARLALVDGVPAAVWMAGGEPRVVFRFTISGDTITAIDLAGDPDELRELDITFLRGLGSGGRGGPGAGGTAGGAAAG